MKWKDLSEGSILSFEIKKDGLIINVFMHPDRTGWFATVRHVGKNPEILTLIDFLPLSSLDFESAKKETIKILMNRLDLHIKRIQTIQEILSDLHD